MERLTHRYGNNHGRVYHITSSKTDRSTYFLYETDDKTQKRIAKAKSPTDLKKHIKP